MCLYLKQCIFYVHCLASCSVFMIFKSHRFALCICVQSITVLSSLKSQISKEKDFLLYGYTIPLPIVNTCTNKRRTQAPLTFGSQHNDVIIPKITTNLSIYFNLFGIKLILHYSNFFYQRLSKIKMSFSSIPQPTSI